MNLNAFTVLVGIALILAVISIVKTTWPILPVSVILVCAALLIK